MNQPCNVQVTGTTEGIPGILVEITLFDSEQSINQQLINKGLARPVSQGKLFDGSSHNYSELEESTGFCLSQV